MPDYPQQQRYQSPSNMQGYYNPGYYPKPEGAKPHGANMKIAMIMILIGIVVVGFVLIFTLTGREEPVAAAATTGAEQYVPPPFVVGGLTFASAVNSDMSYSEVSDATFRLGDPVWVYFEVTNLQSGELKQNWKISYEEYITVIGPDGRIVDDWTGYLGRTTDDAEPGQTYSFSLAHELQTDSTFSPGEYEVTLFIDDVLNDKEQTASSAFRLV